MAPAVQMTACFSVFNGNVIHFSFQLFFFNKKNGTVAQKYYVPPFPPVQSLNSQLYICDITVKMRSPKSIQTHINTLTYAHPHKHAHRHRFFVEACMGHQSYVVKDTHTLTRLNFPSPFQSFPPNRSCISCTIQFTSMNILAASMNWTGTLCA